MRTLLSWSTALSLFCSLSVTQFAVSGHPSAQWAAAGNAQAIQRELSAFVTGSGSAAVIPAAPVAVAGRPVATKAAPAERLDPIASWLIAEGRPGHIGSRISAALGIGSGSEDLQVVGKGYKTDDGIVHAFNVSTTTAHKELIMFQKTADWTVTWRVSQAGQIVTTVRVDDDVHVVPNSQYADLFAQELAYWEAKVPTPAAASNGTGTN